MRSSKLHEPQPYLEPNSPRSKMAARGLIDPSGEPSSLSAAAQEVMVVGEDKDKEDQKHAPDEGENGSSGAEGSPGDHEAAAPGAGEQSGAASSSTSATAHEAPSENVRVIVTEPAQEEGLHVGTGTSDGAAESERDQEQRGTEMHGEEEEVKVKVKPAPGSLYADLGDFEPVNLLSFAYQIASGMVSKT